MGRKNPSSAAQRIVRLKRELAATKVDLEKVREDLRTLRQWWQSIFTEVLSIHGDGKAVNAEWIVKKFAQAFKNSKTYWGWN